MERTVVVALDGSRNAEKVLPYLEPLLLAWKARAVLLQVRQVPDAAAAAYLKAVSGRLVRKKIRCRVEVSRGEAAVGILRAAEEHKADLVAFTSHGQGGLARWVFGSVAQKVLRGCGRSLFVVRALEPVRVPVRRVVVPLDGSVASEAVRPQAVAVARAFGARVQLLYVAPARGLEAKDSKLRGWTEREKARMGARFAEMEREEADLAIDRIVDEGDAAGRIVDRAGGRTSSVVVMGSHGRTGFDRWVYGSVSEKVLQACRVPVLIARATC